MPVYVNSPFKPPVKLVVAGLPEYLFGSYNYDQPWGKIAITTFSLTSDVASVTGIIVEGNIPAVGDFISTQGTPFDVTHATIVSVTVNNTSTGNVTITYAATHADIGSAASGGTAKILTQETSETIVNGASWPVTTQFNGPQTSIERSVTLVIHTPANTLTGTVTAQFQAALRDEDSDYYNVGSSLSITNSATVQAQEITLANELFYRVLIAGITGGAGTIIAKII